MAKKDNASRRRKKPTGKSTALLIVCGGLAFVVAALPTVIVLIVGMIPSIVAYIIDLTPGRYATRCVAGLNIAGVVPFLNRMWGSTNDLPAAINVVTDVYAWLAFYAASGVGWMLFVSLPSFVASFKTYSAKRRANALRERLDKLKEEWGDEITGNVSGSAGDPGSAAGSAGDPSVDAQNTAPA